MSKKYGKLVAREETIKQPITSTTTDNYVTYVTNIYRETKTTSVLVAQIPFTGTEAHKYAKLFTSAPSILEELKDLIGQIKGTQGLGYDIAGIDTENAEEIIKWNSRGKL